MFKIESKFRKYKKKSRKKFSIFKMLLWIVSFNKKILVIGSQWVNKQSQDFAYHSERLFQPEFLSQGWINVVNVLSLRFVQCFGPFTMLLVQESSETDAFRYLSKHLFGCPRVQNYTIYDGHLFFEKAENWIKIFKMEKKKKIFLLSGVISSQNVAINWLS